MVLAWSHIYLARIYDDEGNPQVVKTEYESALAVEGAPEQAKPHGPQKSWLHMGAGTPVARP